MSDAIEPTVIALRQGRIGRITLNRPKALNALDPGMIRAISAALAGWRDDPAVHAVVIEGAGGRAFCAGGDIRAIRAMVMAGDAAGVEQFFAEEYALILQIARYPKPYVALIDGICMGGGMGLSVHGTYRVTSEAATFAMPETAIGMFPDVGATFALPRLRGYWGMYLALTGARVGGGDAVWLGIATHFVSREALAGLGDAIAEDGLAALGAVATSPPAPTLARHDVGAFGQASVAGVLAGLRVGRSAFAEGALETLHQVSPSAVLASFDIVRAGGHRTLAQALEAELAQTRVTTRHPDFLEGVRAMVVDKDRAPRWVPAAFPEA